MSIDPQITAAILGALAGFLLSAIYDLWRRQRKIVEWECNAISLLANDKARTGDMHLVIDKSLVSGNPDHRGVNEPVNNAYVFLVELRNVGNVALEKINAVIELDDTARIVKCDTQPSSLPGYVLEPKIKDNRLSCEIPLLNSRGSFSEVMFEIVSIENSGEKCELRLIGNDVEERQRRSTAGMRMSNAMFGMTGALCAAIVIWLAVLVDRLTGSGLLSSPQTFQFGTAGLAVFTIVMMVLWFVLGRAI
jgi:hypothetical protein